MSDRRPIVFSVPESGGGATPAATLAFFTVGYRPPRQDRSSSRDTVHNQNGIFKYVYDNGPGPYAWDQFQIEVNDAFSGELGDANTQWANLLFLWNYQDGPMGMEAPDGVYSVGWADAPLERQFMGFPGAAGDKVTYRVVVNIEEQ